LLAQLRGLDPCTVTAGQMNYDLRRLKTRALMTNTLKTNVSRRPPLNAMCERSTPSRTNPQRAATRCDAS